MDSETQLTIFVGACIMSGAIWYGSSHLLGEAIPVAPGSSTETTTVEPEHTDQEVRSPESDVVTGREDMESQKLQLEWDKETASIQQRARMREEEYRARLRQYEAEDRRRELEQRQAREVEELRQQQEAEAIARLREEESILRRQPKPVVREVLIPDPVPGRYVPPSQRAREPSHVIQQGSKLRDPKKERPDQ